SSLFRDSGGAAAGRFRGGDFYCVIAGVRESETRASLAAIRLRADCLHFVFPFQLRVRARREPEKKHNEKDRDWHSRNLCAAARYVHKFRSSVRYWIASLMCCAAMLSAPSRSAIVRATFKMRS